MHFYTIKIITDETTDHYWPGVYAEPAVTNASRELSGIRVLKTFFSFIFLLITVVVMAQETSGNNSPVRFGIKAGVSSSVLNTNIEMAETASMELFYGEGTKLTGTELKTNYLRIPVLFQYEHNSGLHLETGLQLGYMLNYKLSENGNEIEDNLSNQLSKIGSGIVFGFGYRMKNGLGLDLRYTRGLDNPIGATIAKLVVLSGSLSFVF